MLFKLLGYMRKSEIVCLQTDLSLPLLFAVAVVTEKWLTDRKRLYGRKDRAEFTLSGHRVAQVWSHRPRGLSSQNGSSSQGDPLLPHFFYSFHSDDCDEI